MNAPITTPPPLAAKQLLDVRQVSEMLGCSPRHIFRLADAGKMPAPVRVGCLVRWSRTVIDSWIESGCPAVRR
jgi:excisionase family DNA binding protein